MRFRLLRPDRSFPPISTFETLMVKRCLLSILNLVRVQAKVPENLFSRLYKEYMKRAKKETPSVKGVLKLELFGPDGKLKEERIEKNLIVTGGLGFITSKMTGGADNIMSHMAVGTDNTAAATGQTGLVTQLAIVSLDSDNQATTTTTNDSIEYVATFPAGTGTGDLVEAGIFNAASSGLMLCRTVFATITKGASDSLVVTWKLIFASA